MNREDWSEKNVAQKGFTLIELLVVIAILGILAVVGVLAFGGLTDDAKTAVNTTELSQAEGQPVGVRASRHDGAYPADHGRPDAATPTRVGDGDAQVHLHVTRPLRCDQTACTYPTQQLALWGGPVGPSPQLHVRPFSHPTEMKGTSTMSAAQRSRYRKLRAGVSDESGSALLIALVMIFVVAILATAVLSYTGTSLTATKSVRDDRTNLYAADGAVDTAIQNIKNADPTENLGYDGGDPCALTVPAVSPQPTVSVACEGATEASAIGSGDGGNSSNQPFFAIQTLGRRANQWGPPNKDINNYADLLAFWTQGSAAEPGLLFSPSFSNAAGVAKLKGGVFSNSSIVADTGTLQTNEGTSFTGRQDCTVSRGGKILVEGSATSPKNCVNLNSYPGVGGYGDDTVDPKRNDPKYTSRADLQGLPAHRVVPACPGSGNLVTFEPGWYDDAKALSQLTSTCKGVDGLGADLWFKPGLYYFDFRDSYGAYNCTDGGGSQTNEWCVGNAKGNPRIVGGTPKDWDPNPATTTTTYNPTTAVSTNFTNAAAGAAIDNNSATAASYSSGSSTLVPTTDEGGDFGNRSLAYQLSNGTVNDSNSASYTSSCVLFFCGSADIVLGSYPTIPVDAVPSSAVLKYRHRESSTSNIGTLKVEVLSASNQVLCSQNVSATSQNNPGVTSWTLPANCLDTAAKVNGAKVRYTTAASGMFTGSRTFWLDGAELAVTWASSAGRSLTVSGFNAAVPAGASNITASLTVDHHATGATNPQVVLSPGGSACTKSINGGGSNGNGAVTLDVSSCLNTSAKFSNLSVVYSATMSGNQSVTLDGMRLEVSYTAITRPSFPGACDPDGPGVQFVFAGDSRVRFVDGTVNLCAGPPPGTAGQSGYSAQHIAVYDNPALPTLQPSGVTTSGSGITNAANAVTMAEQPTNQWTNLGWHVNWNSSATSGTVSLNVPGLAGSSWPGLPANTKITKVQLRAQYDSNFDFWQSLFGTQPSINARIIPPTGTANASQCLRSGLQSNNGQALTDWGSPKQDVLDVTDCFRTTQSNPGTDVDVNKLKNFKVDWWGSASCGFLSFSGCDYSVNLDGLELELTLSPVNANQPAALPAQGCIVAKPNYGRGNNGGDDKSCAVMRWGSSDGAASGTTDLFNSIFGNDPNAPSTMVSISGTVYTPAAAVDIAEYGRYCQQTRKNRFLWWIWDACDGSNANAFSGVNYPVVDRGIVARTVRIRGLKVDPEYTDYVVGCGREVCGATQVPNAKLVTLESRIVPDGVTDPVAIAALPVRIEAQVCYGPIKTVGVDGYAALPSDAQIGSSNRYCTGDGTGAPVVATWTDKRAQT